MPFVDIVKPVSIDMDLQTAQPPQTTEPPQQHNLHIEVQDVGSSNINGKYEYQLNIINRSDVAVKATVYLYGFGAYLKENKVEAELKLEKAVALKGYLAKNQTVKAYVISDTAISGYKGKLTIQAIESNDDQKGYNMDIIDKSQFSEDALNTINTYLNEQK